MNVKEIKKVEKEIKDIEEKIKKIEDEKESLNNKLKNIGFDYKKFFLYRWHHGDDKCKFKLYKKFPSIAKFKVYIKYYGDQDRFGYDDPHHPLDVQASYEDTASRSYFNPEELAVFIKHLYQFQTGREYNILTIGNMIEIGGLCNVYPKLYYLIGENERLEEYQEYNGKFYEDLDKFKFNKPQKGLIAIPHVGEKANYYNQIKYSKTMDCYEYKTIGNNYKYYFEKDINVFKEELKYHLNEIKMHKDIFEFPIAKEDNFISNILYSIMIYKYMNGIFELTDQDYDDIIYELYGEKITPISEQTQTDIPKQLKYIKNYRIREIFEPGLLKISMK